MFDRGRRQPPAQQEPSAPGQSQRISPEGIPEGSGSGSGRGSGSAGGVRVRDDAGKQVEFTSGERCDVDAPEKQGRAPGDPDVPEARQAGDRSSAAETGRVGQSPAARP